MSNDAPSKTTLAEPVGDLTIRWWLEHSHALSFEFLDQEREVVIDGDVKWDGCVNWSTAQGRDFHFCEPSDAENLTSAFKVAWSLAAQYLPTWDGDWKRPLKLKEPAT